MFHPLTPRRRRLVPAIAVACLAPFGAFSAPLTEADALRLALARPEHADLARARLGEADADALQARTWANPSLELVRDKTGAARETSWQLSQPVDLSGRRGLRSDAADARRAAAEEDNRTLAAERTSELRRAFHDVVRQQETVRAIEAWVARFAAIGRVIDRLAHAGEASGYDRRRIVREQLAAEARLAEARAELDRDRSRLEALLGQPAVDGVSGQLLPDAPADLATLRARIHTRPDLAALAARATAAEADDAATRRNFPEIAFGIGGKQVDDGIVRETGTLFSVTIPLPVFDRQQAAGRRTAAQAMAARAELALAQQQAEGELVGRHRQLTQLIAAATRYRQDAVTPSADLVRVAEAAYRAGESSILELLDAYKGALEAETTALDLEGKARNARIELDQLTGSAPQ